MNNKTFETADNIAQTIREVLETTEQQFKTTISDTLNKIGATGSSYFTQQSIRRTKLRKLLQKDAKDAIRTLEQVTNNAAELAGINADKLNKQIKAQTGLLIGSAFKAHGAAVGKIVRLEKIRPLQDAIFTQTQRGINEGFKVKTKSGMMGYKEYMEMSVRTTLQTEISEQQLKFNSKAGVVFYISNVYADCADDHKDYQGKVYYDNRYKSFGLGKEMVALISKKIRQDKMMSIQKVRNGKPYLTTRPNCRHKITPLSIEQGLNVSKVKLIKDLKLSTGSYKKANYKDSQKQRYNERQIIHFKSRKEINKALYKKTGDENYLIQSQKDSVLTTKYQKSQRDLLKSNPTLDRDYRRETRNIVLKDLGAKYNINKK